MAGIIGGGGGGGTKRIRSCLRTLRRNFTGWAGLCSSVVSLELMLGLFVFFKKPTLGRT
jgi:hypothetical protein